MLIYFILHQRPVKLCKLRNARVARVAGTAGIVICGLSKEVNILGLDYRLEVCGDSDILCKLSYSVNSSLAVLVNAHVLRALNAHSLGYIAVFLDRYGVKAELTATKRAAIHRYTFPESEKAGFILDFDYSLQRQKNEEMQIEVISDTEIRGRKKTVYWAFDQYINFYAEFSKPFTYELVTDSVMIPGTDNKIPQSKVLLHFATSEGEKVLVKVGISGVDMAGARRNVEVELPDWDFDMVRKEASSDWQRYLSKIDISTKDEDQKKIFYTALYHTAVAPNLFADVDGRYLGMDLRIHQTSADRPVYTVFSLWDTFRALHPLMTIIDPGLNNQFIRSLIRKHEEGGIFPMWDLASNYTGTMIGYHAVPVIVDAYMKGQRDFDVETAYQACLRTAQYDTAGIHCPPLVLPHLMPKSKYYKNTLGYIPCDFENESVAKALEYAYNDWCISQFANEMNDTLNHVRYGLLGKAYEKYFDKSTRFMRGVDSKGKWRTPFNPRSSNHRNDDYCEGTAWQWTWFVPHDIEGLVALMGGKEAFSEKLDSLFTVSSKLEGESVSSDISGLIGQYAHGNEPSHHILHMYNYIDQPWKTQALVDSVLHSQYFNAPAGISGNEDCAQQRLHEIMSTLYTDQPDGLCGNEDCGQMSAWYILNSMGFYQVCPGKPVYSIGRPLFDETTINLSDGKTFTIRTNNNSSENKYIQAARLNGNPLTEPFFTHEDIVAGGILEFDMGSTPSKWGINSNR